MWQQPRVLWSAGECELVVCDGPTFRRRIEFLKSEKVWDSKTGSWYLKVDEAELVQNRGTK